MRLELFGYGVSIAIGAVVGLFVGLLFLTVVHAQTVPTPAPVPAPATGVWTLVKHVRFPVPSDQGIAVYPSLQICENEAYMYGIDHAQWFTDYTCELRAASPLHRRFHHYRRH